MARKKKIKENIIEKNGYLYEEIETNNISLKPLPNEEGNRKYTDILLYLIRVLPYDDINIPFYTSLYSYGMSHNGLTNRQISILDKHIEHFETEGIL